MTGQTVSAMQQLSDSGLFNELPPQSNGSVCFQVEEMGAVVRGASIYVVRSDSEMHIRVGALENNRFPNNRQLAEFVRRNAHGTVHGAGNSSYAYQLASGHVGAVINVIRTGRS